MMDIEDIFLEMITSHLDDLRSGKLPKGKFLGKYMARLTEADKVNAFRYKRPQVIGEGKEPDNNWLDYILKMEDEEFFWFRESIKK